MQTTPSYQELRGQQTEQERNALLETLVQCRNDRSEAAAKLGVHRRTLYRLLKRHGIPGREVPLERVRGVTADQQRRLAEAYSQAQ